VDRTIALWLSILVACTGSCAAADWPQFLGENRDGISTETGLARAWPAGGPKVLWTVPLAEGFGPACIRDGRVYVLDREAHRTDILRCLDLATGKQHWTFPYTAPGQYVQPGSRTTPACDGTHVFAVGPAGDIHCVTAADGKVVWKKHLLRDFGGGPLPPAGVCQSPLLASDALIVAPLTGQVGVAALAKTTGEVLWKSPPLGDQMYASPRVAQVDGADQVVVVGRTRVDAVEVGTGKPLWTFDGWRCNQPATNPVPVGDGRFFWAASYGLGGIMLKVARQGEAFEVTRLFENRRFKPVMHNPLFYRGHLYLNSNALMCLDLDGNVMWTSGRTARFEMGNLLIADGLIYILDGAGGSLTLAEASPEGYNELATAKVLDGPQVWSPMALSNGRLVLRDKRKMKCLDVKAP
jgi:outer membrane protein assembly factor BamB